MKTLFKNILVLAVMLGTLTSYANSTLEVSPTFNDVKKGNSITVTDSSGLVVFSGLINFNGNISNLYDFSQLNDGVYTIEVNKDYEIEINTVEIKNNTVSFINQGSEKFFKPVFRVEDNRIIISKLALNSADMQVDLYFENELIHTETISGNKVLNRIYKLDKTIKGEYSAIVTSNNRVYVENFKI
ncbi:hypothetical protein HSX10_08325 [Winogradskyella undariae]|uniref:hypothetical protein n=1 Tax=Winogradskyella undariae TaxID=1285465 RepID=UPI00156BC90C|nr:hypothetical protein [Winogradskyella undariae]NRR91567.1 hypothetical protein [Winogradskyella undariae]QNK76722.1 hypothetical protein H7F37_11370 [Winogradskyella sp. PAMC22761]